MKQILVDCRALSLCLICTLGVTISRAVADGPAQPQAGQIAPLVQRAMDDLQATREIAASVTNEEEIATWQQRIAFSEKELENVKQRVALEEREKEMAQAETRLGARHNLREVLRTIETDTRETEEKGRDLDKNIRHLQSDRGELAATIESKGDNEQAIEQGAEREQKLQNMDAEIRARILERDAIELRLRLAQEAVRIDQALRARELNPRATIRQILEARQEAGAAQKATDDAQTLRDMLDKQKQAVDEALTLSNERFSHLDGEIDTLESLYDTGRRSVFDFTKKTDTNLVVRQRQVVQMLAGARSQRRFLQQRIEFQQQQAAALDDSLKSVDRIKELLVNEFLFQKQEKANTIQRFLERITLPGGILLGLFVLNTVLRRIVLPVALKSESLFVARRAVTYMLSLVGVMTLTMFFLEDLKSIATILGLAGAAVVIALQDLCSAFAGWFVIITSRKVLVGDRIEVDGHRGDVVDIQLLRTTLLEIGNWLGTDEATGRIVVIPNNFIFKNQFFNYSHMHPYIWGKVDVEVTFETPSKLAEELLMRILKEETRKDFEEAVKSTKLMEDEYGVPDAVYEPRISTLITKDGVLFGLYFCCHYRQDDEVRNRLNRRILAEFEKDSRIRFAYPTRREIAEPHPVSYTQGQHK